MFTMATRCIICIRRATQIVGFTCIIPIVANWGPEQTLNVRSLGCAVPHAAA